MTAVGTRSEGPVQPRLPGKSAAQHKRRRMRRKRDKEVEEGEGEQVI